VGGQATDLEIYAKDLINTRRVLANIYVETTGQPIDKIERDMERDYHMTAPEAVAYGICDAVFSRQTHASAAPKPTAT
jgi:ATP-dependent Clp protease protease subunit